MDKNKVIETIKNEHIAHGLLVMAMYSGAKSLDKIEGLWQKQISSQWLIKCNGHSDEIDGVPPFSWYLEFNGWPAGVLEIMGGGILPNGEAANETTLKEALVNFVTNS